MKEFNYVLKDDYGIHARPAGILVKEVAKFKSEVKVTLREKVADARRIFALMGLGAKKGDELLISISGEDEDEVTEKLKEFFSENF